MKNEVIKNNELRGDQIDLVDLIKILLKNKVLILLTGIIITLMSAGGAFYIKVSKIEKFYQNFEIKEYNNKGISIPNLNTETLLYNDEVVSEFYKNENLNRYFTDRNEEREGSYEDKRNFLNNIIKLEKKEIKLKKNYTVITKIKNNEKLSVEMIDLYLSVLNKQRIFQITQNLGGISELELKVKEYEKKLNQIKDNINVYISSLPKEILENQSMLEIIELNKPILVKNKKVQEIFYEKYYNKLLLLKDIKDNKTQVVKTSSIYEVEEKSKTLKIIIMGMILGLFLGVMAAFMKEFFENIDLKN